MAVENEKRIAELKEQIEKAKQLKYKYEARLDELQRQKERLLLELAELKVLPEDLESEIRRLQTDVDALLREAASLLPSDLLRG
jgi:chromosome segregation ATPase